MVKSEFYRELERYIQKNEKCIRKPWYQDRVSKTINEMLKARCFGQKRSSLQYHLMTRFDLLEDGNEFRLIEKRKNDYDPIVEVAPVESYFDILYETHMNTGHGGRDKMLNTIKQRFKIPRSAIEIFIALCATCSTKKSKHKGVWF